MIGFAMCGSYCTHAEALRQLRCLIEAGESVLPIMSENVYTTDTRFGTARALCEQVETLCGRPIVHTVTGAEPLGPMTPLEALLICPCTGNTLACMANGITDTAVKMAAKAHLRTDRPLIIALATNDALSANLPNIGTMLCRRSVYFVPMRQDDPEGKPHSLVACFDMVLPTLAAARRGERIHKLFV